MKIKKSKLRTIIKEEIENILKESEQYVYRNLDGELRISDDDGNDDAASHLEGEFGHLVPGGGGATIFPDSGRGYGRTGGHRGGSRDDGAPRMRGDRYGRSRRRR